MKSKNIVLVLAVIFFLPTVTVGFEYEVDYLGSCLWTGVQDVVVEGDYAYCAFANGPVVLDITAPDNPIVVGSIYCQGTCGSVFKAGSVLYLATFSAGLIMVDVSDPADPYVIGRYDIRGFTRDVFVEGGIAYVAVSDSGLYIIDVSNPSFPALIARHNVTDRAVSVVVRAGLAYVCDWEGGLLIADVSVPESAVTISSYDTPFYACDIVLDGNLAYVADYNSFHVMDVTDPTAPVLLGSCEEWVTAIFHSGSYVYGLGLYNELCVLDVSDPATPTLMSKKGNLGYGGAGLFVRDEIAYVACGDSGFKTFNVSNPGYSYLLGSYGGKWGARRVAKDGNLVCMTDASGVLRIVDVFDPVAPSPISEYNLGSRYIFDFAIRDSLIFLADHLMLHSGELRIVNVADPAAPAFLSACDIPGFSYYKQGGICVQGDYAYVASTHVFIIDISNPALPALVGTYDDPVPGATDIDIFVQGTYAYVMAYAGSVALSVFYVLDVSDPASPIKISDYCFWVDGNIHVQDSILFTGGDFGGATLWNVADAALPTRLSNYDTPGMVDAVFAKGEALYLAGVGGGIEIVDVSNPLSPVRAGVYDTPGGGSDVFVEDSIIYVADGSSLMLLKTTYFNSCCRNRGDIDHSGQTDVSDLTRFVDYLFLGGLPPACDPESDIDGNGQTDISDLTFLVQYLYLGGPLPPPCE